MDKILEFVRGLLGMQTVVTVDANRPDMVPYKMELMKARVRLFLARNGIVVNAHKGVGQEWTFTIYTAM